MVLALPFLDQEILFVDGILLPQDVQPISRLIHMVSWLQRVRYAHAFFVCHDHDGERMLDRNDIVLRGILYQQLDTHGEYLEC